MNHMTAVRRFQAGDAPAAAAIIRGLPDYFTEDVPAKAERDAASHEAWVTTESGTVTGIAIAARKSAAGAEILWIAVDAARQPSRDLRSRPPPNPVTSTPANRVTPVPPESPQAQRPFSVIE
jgi:hypothetical protein